MRLNDTPELCLFVLRSSVTVTGLTCAGQNCACGMLNWTQSPILIRVRLFASLVLVFFTATHFINHALGLVSLDAMEAGRNIFLGFWRNTVIQFLFPISLFLHAQSSIWRLMFRQTWRYSRREKVKILTGLTIPFFLLLHISATRLQWWINGHDNTYAYYLYYHFRDAGFYFMLTTSILIWVHAYLGLVDLLSLKPWFEKFRVRFALTYSALPILGLAGLISASGQVDRLAKNAAWVADLNRRHGGTYEELLKSSLMFYGIGLALTVSLLASLYFIRIFVLRRKSRSAIISLKYAGGQSVLVPKNITILESSLLHGVEHAHVCGGNGRCSTCRVRILAGTENLTPAESTEKAVLQKIGAEGDIRLACQAKILGAATVAPLVHSAGMVQSGAAANLLKKKPQANGFEKEVIIFFSDLRGFTSFSEKKLPYDVVFVLNQYFRSMGKIIEQHNGQIDKFIGDGIMAIFALDEPVADGAINALNASLRMKEQLQLLNEVFLSEELEKPLEIGIGLHSGHAIVGEMGYGSAAHITAIGDVVNTASRLEHANKQLQTWLVFSEDVANHGGVAEKFENYRKRVKLRGKSESMQVFAIPTGAQFSELSRQ
jgi:adenylate cyclase